MELKLITHYVSSDKIKTLKESLVPSSPKTNKKVNLAKELKINILNQDELKKLLD